MHDENVDVLHMFHEDEVVESGRSRTHRQFRRIRIAALAKCDHILAVQAQPDFHDGFMRAVLDFTRPGMPQDRHDAAAASLDIPTDGALFAEWMAAFLTGRQHHEVAS